METQPFHFVVEQEIDIKSVADAVGTGSSASRISFLIAMPGQLPLGVPSQIRAEGQRAGV